MRAGGPRWAVLALLAVLVPVALVAAPALADDDDDDDGQTSGGTGLVVTVSPAPVTPAPSRSPSPAASVTPSPRPTADGELPTESVGDGFSISGVLYVSGLTTAYAPSIDPWGGTVTSSFTVKNLTDSTVTARTDFWLTNIFGAELSSTPTKWVILGAGQTRVIEVELERPGQWSLLTAHYTLTPPEEVDGITLLPLTREAAVIFLPWLLLVVVVLGAVSFVAVRWVRASRVTRAAGVTA